MLKQSYVSRYLLIIKRLQKGPAPFKEIQRYLHLQSELSGLDFTLEMRTFQRELHEIRELFGIDIKYDRKRSAYHIAEEHSLDSKQSMRLLEGYEMLELLKVAGQHANNIVFERRRPAGLHHFYGLLHAIKNQKVISISYQKFTQDEPASRMLIPLALKESRGRWYLIAEDYNKGYINPYGLDRIMDLEITRRSFEKRQYDIAVLFKEAFGIIRSEKIESVELSFTPLQGKYIKTYRLHHSQQIIQDTEEALVIKLELFLTHDLIMELLSYGREVKVLAPKTLAMIVKEAHLEAASLYK